MRLSRPLLLLAVHSLAAGLAACGDDITAAEFCERAQASVATLLEKASPCLSDLDEQALQAQLEATLPPADGCEAHVEAQCSQEDREGAVALADCIDALSTCSANTALVFSEAVQDCLDAAREDVGESCLSL